MRGRTGEWEWDLCAPACAPQIAAACGDSYSARPAQSPSCCRRCLDRLAVVAGSPQGPGRVPDPGMELIGRHDWAFRRKVSLPLVTLGEDSETSVYGVAGFRLAAEPIEVEVGESRVETAEDLLDGAFSAAQLCAGLVLGPVTGERRLQVLANLGRLQVLIQQAEVGGQSLPHPSSVMV
jgi:hypothetical protein